MIDIYINNIRIGTLGWIRESVSFPVPKAQNNTIVVPGRSAPIRYTEALGRVSYEPRTFEIVLTMLGTRKEFDEKTALLTNQFLGKLCKIRTSEEPEFYIIGTVAMESTYDPLIRKGQIIISSEDADAYRYHVEETVISVTKSGKITLMNDYMPCIPTIIATAETSLAWSVGSDTFRKTISSGTWTISELELNAGNHQIMVQTEGTVTFRYREGRL